MAGKGLRGWIMEFCEAVLKATKDREGRRILQVNYARREVRVGRGRG